MCNVTTTWRMFQGFSVSQCGCRPAGWPRRGGFVAWYLVWIHRCSGNTAFSQSYKIHTYYAIFSLLSKKCRSLTILVGVTPTHSSKGSSSDGNSESPSAAPCKVLSVASCCVLRETEWSIICSSWIGILKKERKGKKIDYSQLFAFSQSRWQQENKVEI